MRFTLKKINGIFAPSLKPTCGTTVLVKTVFFFFSEEIVVANQNVPRLQFYFLFWCLDFIHFFIYFIFVN
jgi:hypothetical protein